MVLEKTLESPLDCMEIQPVHPKGNQSWIFIGRTNVEVETQYFGHLMWRTDSFVKTLILEKIDGEKRRNGRGWDSWMASPTQLAWVWVISGSCWWTGRPVFTKSQTWLYDWSELNTYVWNLERWYCWNYLHGSNGYPDIESRLWTCWDVGGRKKSVGFM